MATARSLVFTAGGLTQEAKDADTQIVSAILGNNSGSFTLNAAGTSLLLKVGGTTYLSVSSSAITASGGSVFTGDGSGLTTLNASNLSSGTVPIARVPTGSTGSTVPFGNDARFNPSPSAAGRIIYDTGSAWQALAAGTAGQILQANGAAAPSWVDGQTTSGQTVWSTPANGELGYQTSTAGTLAKCNATAIATCPNAVCVYQGTASTVTPLKDGQPIGILFESGLNSGGTGAPAAGQSVFVSAGTAGRATNNAPTGSGNVVLYLGEIKDLNGGYDNTLGSILNVWPRVGQPIVRN